MPIALCEDRLICVKGGDFYPKGTKPADFLREYAWRLTIIEGNTTFYAVPSKKTIEGWVADTPGTFRFCPKIPKTISHAGTLSNHIDEAMEFIRVMSRLGSRLGPMFLQLPPAYSPRCRPVSAGCEVPWIRRVLRVASSLL